MIDFILRWSLSNRLVVLVLALVVLVGGAVTVRRMPIDVFPDLTAPMVTVVTEAHSMAPQELESRVTFPIETALNGAPGVRRVRSATGVGISIVYVEFEWGTDVYRARQTVSEKLQLVRDALPSEVEAPVLAPVSSVMGEVLFVAMTSSEHTPMAVRTEADVTVRRRLLAVPGVSQVVPIGGDVRQFQVRLRPERLAAHRITVSQVIDALSASNVGVSAGFIVESGQEYLVTGEGRVRAERDIAESVVLVRDGAPVLVRHLGDVRIGAAPKRGDGSYRGAPAVVLGIQKQPGANTIELTARIDRELDAIARTLPRGMSVHRDVFRQADFIGVAVKNVTHALRDGVILVLLVVVVFLASARASVVTVVAIPLSLCTAALALHFSGATLNTMTLGGMAIAVGELVDDAIVDVENVVRRLRENRALPEGERRAIFSVVLDASREIRGSIVFATVVVVLAFLPLFFLSGVEGRLLRPLAIAYVVSLMASLLVALTVTPVLCSLLLAKAKTVRAAHEPFVVRWLKGRYAPVLDATMKHGRAVLVVAVVLLVSATLSLGRAGRAFLPEFREGTLTIAVVSLPGISLDESNRIGLRVEQILMRHPEVVAVARRTGRAELDEHAQGVNAAELDVSLRGTSRGRGAFMEALRAELSAVQGANITLGQPISHRIDHMLSGTRAAIAIKVFGQDLYELRRLAAQVRAAVQRVPGVVDLAIEQQVDIPFVRVRFDREAIARYGLSVRDVARVLEVASGSHTVSQVTEGAAAFDLVVMFDRAGAQETAALGEVPVVTAGGAVVPLRALATIQRDRAPNEIAREGVQRRLAVTCNVAGRDLGSVVGDVRRSIDGAVRFAPGYRYELSGQFESAEDAGRTIALLGALSVLGVFALLASAFRSARDAALVMANLPLALIGGVVGVFVQGGVLSIASLVGFVTLFGIATRNGIMLVSHIRHVVEVEGETDIERAVRRAAVERLAPVLMTAMAAGLALVPLAMAAGEPGSEIQAPMAVVILCGLLSSTVLNMLVVPTMYLRWGALRSERAESQGSGARQAILQHVRERPR